MLVGFCAIFSHRVQMVFFKLNVRMHFFQHTLNRVLCVPWNVYSPVCRYNFTSHNHIPFLANCSPQTRFSFYLPCCSIFLLDLIQVLPKRLHRELSSAYNLRHCIHEEVNRNIQWIHLARIRLVICLLVSARNRRINEGKQHILWGYLMENTVSHLKFPQM